MNCFRVTNLASKPAPWWVPLSTGTQVLPGACSKVSFPQVHSLLWEHLSAVVEPPGAAGGTLPHCTRPWAAGAQLPLRFVHIRLEGNLCSGAWRTSSPSFLTDLGLCKEVSLTYSLSPDVLSPRLHHHWWAHRWSTADLSCSQLALALLYKRETSSSFSQKPAFTSSTTKTLLWKPNKLSNSYPFLHFFSIEIIFNYFIRTS